MSERIVKLYHCLATHRVWLWTSLAGLTTVLALLTAHLTLDEDIADFLPRENGESPAPERLAQVPGADRIFIIFRHSNDSTASLENDESLTDAANYFWQVWSNRHGGDATAPEEHTPQQDIAMLYQRLPLLLTTSDYQRIDSLLQQPDYMARRMTYVRQLLMMPGTGITTAMLRYDPLGLFTPAIQRTAPDVQMTIVQMTSPYGASETARNSLLVDSLLDTAHQVESQLGNVDISITGGPVIAVGNARQIRYDSWLAITVAMVLIVILLYTTLHHTRNMLLMLLTIAWGWLFALGIMALLRTSVSIIVIGISSIILGIAVNYPLHLIAHLRHTPDIATALRDTSNPLLIGNITTVGAFLALLPLHSRALQDLGLFSALLLAGTIIFVLVFLPHLVRRPTTERPASWADRLADLPMPRSSWVAITIAVLTIVLGIFSFETRFDADLNHINYMTDEQRQNMSLLAGSGAQPAESDIGSALARWHTFVERHGRQLEQHLPTVTERYGFQATAFQDFNCLLHTDYSELLRPTQTGDIATRLADDFNYVGWVCATIVFLFLWLSMGSIKLALISFLPMAISWTWILGLMAICDIHFNVVNIILATFIFGQGDDYTIFITEGCQYEYAHGRRLLPAYRSSIVVSALIMFIGIGALILARHPALHSLAEVTIVGMACVVVTAWLIPPLLFQWFIANKHSYHSKPLSPNNYNP